MSAEVDGDDYIVNSQVQRNILAKAVLKLPG